MMEALARVVRVDDSGCITVEVEIISACGHCAGKDNCGTGAIASAFSGKTQQFALRTDQQCDVGELLRLGLPESSLLRGAALVYLLPLAGLMLGAVLGESLGSVLTMGREAASILLGLLGGFASWGLGRRLARHLECQTNPVVLAHLGKAGVPGCQYNL